MRLIHGAILAVALASAQSAPSTDPPKPYITITGAPKVDPPAPAPSPIPTSVTISGERFELLSLMNYAGPVTWDVTSPTAFLPPCKLFTQKPDSTTDGWRIGASEPSEYAIGKAPTIKVYAVGDGAATIAAWGVADGKPVKLATFQVVAGKGPRPPPDPPEPKPPEPPTPAPQGFRVIFVYETSQPLTPAMQQVMFGEKVRSYLDAKSKGWRRWDKDVDATNERDADIKALWNAAKPKFTAVPCVVVAVNGKADIIPFPTSEDQALEVLKKYGGP